MRHPNDQGSISPLTRAQVVSPRLSRLSGQCCRRQEARASPLSTPPPDGSDALCDAVHACITQEDDTHAEACLRVEADTHLQEAPCALPGLPFAEPAALPAEILALFRASIMDWHAASSHSSSPS